MQTIQLHVDNSNQPTLGMVGTVCPFYNEWKQVGLFEKTHVNMS
jgi:hypothetical protein